MIDDRTKAIDKIAKLLRLAEGKGATPSEAANAAAAAQGIMDRLKVTRASVELHDDSAEGIRRHDKPLVRASRIVRWKRQLAGELAHINQCRVLILDAIRNVPNSSRITLVGRESDIVVVHYLYAYVSREVDRLAKLAVSQQRFHNKGKARVWGSNFRLGAVFTVADRLRQARDKARRDGQADVAKSHGSDAASHALVLVNDHDKRIQQYVDGRWKRHYNESTQTFDADGMVAGARAGETIPIHDAMKEGSSTAELPQ